MTPARPAVVLVPHFHWDREWYEPFQVFRYRLVDAMDTILDIAEANPAFRFTMDGQTAAIEDYLAIRPENEARVRSAVARGQLALGPWLILLDEFLSSGETIVRNLQLGWRGASELGGAMALGYLPDMFGHIAQMPQILRRAGIEHAAFWRGVPGRVEGHAFRWVAPDGSAVRAEYLFDGYGNGLDLLLVPDEIPKAIRDYRELTAQRWGEDPILAMAGTDHLPPSSRLMDWVRRFDDPAAPIAVATIHEYVSAHVRDTAMPKIVGELRSHARGNILPGVLSIRRALKTAMARAERTATEAERLSAVWSTDDPTPFLEVAWRKIIESSAHDSVVGSGTDETVEQVHARLAEATQVARAVRDGVLGRLAAEVPSDGVLVANPLTTARTLVVEAETPAPLDGAVVALAADGAVLPIQELGDTATVLADERMPAHDVPRVLRRIHRRELFGLQIDRVELEPGSLTFHLAEVPSEAVFDLLGLTVSLREAVSAHPGTWRVRTLAEARRRVAVAVPVPASGLAAFRLAPGTADPSRSSFFVGDHRLDNGLVRVDVDHRDGTITVSGADGTVLRDVGRIVDGGDRGDSYNYGPPARDTVVEAPASVRVETIESGPVRSALRILRDYHWPAALAEDPDERSSAAVPVTVETRVELRADEPFVRLTVTFENPVRDHRVRLHVPLPERADRSAAEGQFAVTERGLTGEGGWGEFPLPTYPADGFVSAGAATVLLDDVTEYELVQDGAELALTLLRAVGHISVNLHPLRDEPAASELPIPGGQELGSTMVSRFAVLPHADGWRSADAVGLSARFRSDALSRRGGAPAGGPLPGEAAGLIVAGRDVAVSSLRRIGSGVELRLIAMSPEPVTAVVSGAFDRVDTVDLLGEVLSTSAAAGRTQQSLAPWEIRTLVLS